MTGPIIHINSWPGAGKRTIAKELVQLVGGRLLDNHLILDPATALFPRGTPEAAALREAVRKVLFDAALTLPPDVPIVLTDALSDDDHHLAAPSLDLARQRKAPFVPVVLDLDPDENSRRLTVLARSEGGKLTDAAILEDIRAQERLLRLPGAYDLDVTDLSPQEAASRIQTFARPFLNRGPQTAH